MKKPDNEELTMTFGTFDNLHAGHENFFKQAKELGNKVLTIIARDKTVTNIKGRAPKFTEKERLKNIIETKWCDDAILGDNKDKMKAIKQYKPTIIALGYDQFAFTYSLEKMIIKDNLNTKIVRLKPYKAGIYKSSLIRNKKEESQEN